MKTAKTKNYQSYERWMTEKKVGRPMQAWVWDVEETHMDKVVRVGHWERINV
jgi:hypothetical protein